MAQLKIQYGFTKKKRCAIADTIDIKLLCIAAIK